MTRKSSTWWFSKTNTSSLGFLWPWNAFAISHCQIVTRSAEAQMFQIKMCTTEYNRIYLWIKLTGNAARRKRCPIRSNMWLVGLQSLHCLWLGRMRQSCRKLPLSFKFCIFATNYFSCSRTCRVLVSFDSKHLVSAMRQRRDISSIAWISANGNALLIYRRKFVAPVLLRYSVVKTGHITFHSNVHQQSGCMFCKTAIQETPWGKNWLLKTMAETENRGKL